MLWDRRFSNLRDGASLRPSDLLSSLDLVSRDSTSTFRTIFDTACPLFAKHVRWCVVLHDEPGRYYLGTHELRPKDGYRTGLGGLEIKKAYVSVHLIPIYVHPELLDGVSEQLLSRMQGKSCFNFKKLDAALLSERGALVDRGVENFRQDGRL